MKKFLYFIVCMLLICSLNISILAAGPFTIGGDQGIDDPSQSITQDVIITISGAIVDKYAVDIEFETLEFSYSTGSTWDPSSHTYKPGAGGTWSPAKTIKVTNHSNKGIDYSTLCQTVTDSKFAGLTISALPESGTIVGCEVNGIAPDAAVEISLTGVPTTGELYNEKLGTVTVKIEKAK